MWCSEVVGPLASADPAYAGLLAPPVGLNVYVVNGMAKDVPIGESYKGVMPFLASDVIRTTLLLLFPSITLWLVKYVG